MFENEIREYESVRQEYQQTVADKMGEKQWMEYRHHSHEVRTGPKAEEHVAHDVFLRTIKASKTDAF